jgi:hypothetical protein
MSALADASRNSLRVGWKQIAIGVLLVALGAVSAYALMRETRSIQQERATAEAAAQMPQRPPLTAAEESYARSLWEVHTRVRTDAVRMTFTGLSYKMGDIGLPEVKNRVSPLTQAFGDAIGRVQALEPPSSLQGSHGLYVEALQLYRDSAAEMIKVAADGKEEHLLKAHAMSDRASSNLMEVSEALWPGEYKPN